MPVARPAPESRDDVAIARRDAASEAARPEPTEDRSREATAAPTAPTAPDASETEELAEATALARIARIVQANASARGAATEAKL